MIDIKLIRSNPESIRSGCKRKGVNVSLKEILSLDKKHRSLIQKIEKIREERNKAKNTKNCSEKEREKGKKLKGKIKEINNQIKIVEKELKDLMRKIPNLPDKNVPGGKEEVDNVVLKNVGKKPLFDFPPKSYLEIARSFDLIDTQRAAKVSGSRFAYLKREMVLLEFALINLVFDVTKEKAFIPLLPPVMIKSKVMKELGYTGLEEDDSTYHLSQDDLALVGTSEHSIGSMYKDEILREEDLPLRFVGFSTCFRREAGAYGKDVKGIMRLHQFDKIEMFSFCKPDQSKNEHSLIRDLEELLMQKLQIPYRLVKLCEGDLCTPSAITFDIESWIPSEKRYRETHSSSNCTDYQARGLNIRYHQKDQTTAYVHTVNGTAFAIGRTLIALLENHQQKDGSVKIPPALHKYLGFKVIKK